MCKYGCEHHATGPAGWANATCPGVWGCRGPHAVPTLVSPTPALLPRSGTGLGLARPSCSPLMSGKCCSCSYGRWRGSMRCSCRWAHTRVLRLVLPRLGLTYLAEDPSSAFVGSSLTAGERPCPMELLCAEAAGGCGSTAPTPARTLLQANSQPAPPANTSNPLPRALAHAPQWVCSPPAACITQAGTSSAIFAPNPSNTQTLPRSLKR